MFIAASSPAQSGPVAPPALIFPKIVYPEQCAKSIITAEINHRPCRIPFATAGSSGNDRGGDCPGEDHMPRSDARAARPFTAESAARRVLAVVAQQEQAVLE
jgi:hypothetical protein